MTPYRHEHCSEVPDRPVVECTAGTFVEHAHAAFYPDRAIPTDAAEREALRVAMGQPDDRGATYAQGVAGCMKRYGWAPTLLGGLPGFPPAHGEYLGVQGWYPSLPAHYRRWFPGFGTKYGNGAHSVTVYSLNGSLMWCDPGAPELVKDPKGGTMPWLGEPIAWPVVQAFHRALDGARVVRTRIGEALLTAGGNVGGPDMVTLDPPFDALCDLAVGAQLYELDCTTPVVTVSVAQAVSTPGGITLNANAHFRVVRIATGGAQRLLAVHLPDAHNIRAIGGFSAEQVQAAIAADRRNAKIVWS